MTSSGSNGVVATTGANDAVVEPIKMSGEMRNASGRIRRSLVLSFAERYAAILINFVATAILARLLTPSDYGIFIVGTVIVAIPAILRDFGVLTFLIQEKDLTQDNVRTAYGISLLFGVVLGAAIAISSGWIAEFYGNDGVRRVLLVLAVNFVLTPFGSAVLALLRREMDFVALLWISLASILITASVSIFLALIGFGFMSLAWANLAGAIVTFIMAAIKRPKQFSILPSLKDWRRIMSFGLVATAGILVGEISLRMPELVIGRLLGLAPVGIFGRADSLTNMFNRLVTTGVAPVVVAAFATQHRGGGALKEPFLRAMALMTGLAWPFFGLAALMASPIVHIAFGNGWDAAIPIGRTLCIASSVAVLSNLNWYVLQATGAVAKNLWVQLITQPVAILLVIMAAEFDLVVVTGALIVAASVSVVVSYRFIDRLIGASLDEVVRGSAKSAGVTGCSMVVPILVVLLMRTDGDHIWAPLALASAGAVAGWLLGVRLFRHEFSKEIERFAARFPLWSREAGLE